MTQATTSKKTGLTYTTHRPADRTDPGFKIPGYQLRWLNGAQRESNPNGIYRPINVSDLPADLIKHLQKSNPWLYSEENIKQGGNTIRRGPNREDVLAYAPLEVVEKRRMEVADDANQSMSYINEGAHGMKVDHGRSSEEVGRKAFEK